MSWRSSNQITGQNTVPLGNTRRWGGGGGGGGEGKSETPPAFAQGAGSPYGVPTNGGSSSYPTQGYGAAQSYGVAVKRERDDGPSIAAGASSDGATTDGAAPRKRRSRWGDEKTNLGVTTALGSNVSESELERYAINVRIEEIARKIRSGEVVPPERERSPSPPPTYDAQGRRTNTRDVRYRKKLEEERVRLIDKQIKLDPNYKPPVEYAAAKRNMKPTEKVFLPIKEFPEINFFGLLVGPRGNTLKTMERESGAKISIRGKGSVKVGKGRAGDEEEEEMHCVVNAEDEEKVRKCVRLINQVIETAASTPETQNDHKRNQLRELAALNGTLRDDENQICQNCGQKGHRKYECPEQRNWTAHIVCHRCGQQGHLARDCTQNRAPGGVPGFGGPPGFGGGGPQGAPGAPGAPRDPFNSEYENLMAELGEGSRGPPGGPGMSAPPAPGGQPGPMTGTPMDRPLGPDGKKIPPWRDPNMWNPPTFAGGPPRGPRMGFGGPPHQHQQPYQQQQQQWGGGPGGPQQGGYDYAQQQQHQQPQQHAGYGQNGYQEQQQGQQPAGQPQQQQGGQPDYREAWEAYYRQQGMDPAAAAAAAAAAGGGAGVTAETAGAAGAGGQQDYSKEWEEYYRQQAAAGGGGGGPHA